MIKMARTDNFPAGEDFLLNSASNDVGTLNPEKSTQTDIIMSLAKNFKIIGIQEHRYNSKLHLENLLELRLPETTKEQPTCITGGVGVILISCHKGVLLSSTS